MKITLFASGTIKSNFSYRVLQLGRSLVTRGHDVSIVVPSADKYNNFKKEKISSIDGVKIIQPFQFNTRRVELNLIPYILHMFYIALSHKADLIYIYKPTPITIGGLLGKLVYGTPVVLDMDDLGSEVMRIEGHSLFQRKLVEWCEHIVARFSDRIVVVSTYLYDLYKNKFPLKPILIIPNGVDEVWFSPVNSTSSEKRIVFLGAINRKNILEPLFDVLPNIIKKYPGLKILIIGSGTYLDYFKQKTESAGFADNVEFTGWLALDEARAHLRAGDIGYNYMPDEPTVKASSNMKVPQYMARGVVPLVSRVGDLEKTIGNGEAGYAALPNDLHSLESTILEALSDENSSEKSKQAVRLAAEKFNWNILATQFESWILNKNSEKKKSAYFVTITVPGDVGGAEIRNFYLLKQWTAMKDLSVEVFCISNRDVILEKEKLESQLNLTAHMVKNSIQTNSRMLKSVLLDQLPPFMNNFAASGIGDVFRKRCEENLPTSIHLEQIHAYYAIRKHIPWLKSKGVKIVLDCHNIEFQSFNESLDIFSLPKKIIGKLIVPTLKKLELEGVKQSDVVLACSAFDCEFFKKYNKNTHIIPHGVDVAYFEQTRNHFNPVLIFMGGVGYPPNEDAIRFYLGEIHPLVKKAIPHITFLAIGTEQKWLEERGFADNSVEALGFVDDVRPYLNQASVGICPIRYGSGTRLKILTYMAAFLPVVSTQKGAEGVGYMPGQDILMQDNPILFAEEIIKLIQSENFSKNIAQNGHDFVLKNYDWNLICAQAGEIYQTTLI